MNVLAFDTSTAMLSVALSIGEDYLETNRYIGLKHSQTLLTHIDSMIQESGCSFRELDLIVCGKGPGSFTGLRIGLSTAKGLSFGLDCPLVTVPTLDAMAFQIVGSLSTVVVPVIDAKKKLFYTAFYRQTDRISDYMDTGKNDIVEKTESFSSIIFTGPDADRFSDLCSEARYTVDPLHRRGIGESLIVLGSRLFEDHGADRTDSGPLYIRKSDAEIKTIQKNDL